MLVDIKVEGITLDMMRQVGQQALDFAVLAMLLQRVS
jgi:polyribonucleotide nucleotidyltransferase